MADVNKNIIDAYRSMYEEKTTPEQCVRMTLKKEGGAAGLSAIQKGLKDKGHDVDAKEVISKMSDVKQHKEGDYILEKMDEVDPKAVKKKFKDRKDKDIDNDGDVDSSDEYLHKRRKAISTAMKKESFTLDDIREMCHSKDHDCATYVDHPEFGLGKPVYESHAIPDDDGYVSWYDVEFAHGIEEQVPTEDMQILQTEGHSMKAQKKKEMPKKDEDTVINVDDDDESPDDGETPDNGKDTEDDKKRKRKGKLRKDDDTIDTDADGDEKDINITVNDDDESPDDGEDDMPPPMKKRNGNGKPMGKKPEISKIGERKSTKESVEFVNLLSELMAVDVKGKKKDDADGKEPEEYEDIAQNRSKGETDFIDAHGKKDVVVDGEKEAEKTADSQKKNKEGKHVAQQKAKGEKNPIKSTEAPVKDKEVKDGEGKKSVTKESTVPHPTKKDKKGQPVMVQEKPKVNFGGVEEKVQRSLVDMARDALAGKLVPEMSGHEKVKEKNPFDARTKDAKNFLERMYKRRNGEK